MAKLTLTVSVNTHELKHSNGKAENSKMYETKVPTLKRHILSIKLRKVESKKRVKIRHVNHNDKMLDWL